MLGHVISGRTFLLITIYKDHDGARCQHLSRYQKTLVRSRVFQLVDQAWYGGLDGMVA